MDGIEIKINPRYKRILNIQKKAENASYKKYTCLHDLYNDKDNMTKQEFYSACQALNYGADFILFTNDPSVEQNAIWYSLWDTEADKGESLMNLSLIELIQ